MQNERQINDLVDQRFRLIEYIGGGGGGDVFKAVDTKHADKPVAIKLLRSSFAGDSKARQELFGRFNQEVWTTARLGEHPSIVTVLDSGVDNNQPYLVMEFLGAPPLVGTSLGDLIHAEGSLEPRRVVHLAKQVCSGLHYAHSFEVQLETHTIRGIVHRDVKPSNIFVLQDPMLGETVRILDFGISKTLSDITVTYGTQLVGFIGTLQYASPEQLRGKALDARSDIYSLGAVIYEMLTGDAPFYPETNTFPGWYEAHNYQPVRPFREVSPAASYEIPPMLEELVLSCLEKTPDKRPQSMQLLSEYLEDCIRSLDRINIYQGSPRQVNPAPVAVVATSAPPTHFPSLNPTAHPSPPASAPYSDSSQGSAPSPARSRPQYEPEGRFDTPTPQQEPIPHPQDPDLEKGILGFSEEEILALDGEANSRSESLDSSAVAQQAPVSSPEFLFGFDHDYGEAPEEESAVPDNLKDFMYGFDEEGSHATVVEDHPPASSPQQPLSPVSTEETSQPTQEAPQPTQEKNAQSIEDFLYSFDQNFEGNEDPHPTVVETPGMPPEDPATYLEQLPPHLRSNTGQITGAPVVQDAQEEQVSDPTVVEEKGQPASTHQTPQTRSQEPEEGRSTQTGAPSGSPSPPPPSSPPPVPRTQTGTYTSRPTYSPSRTRTGYGSGPMTQRGADTRTGLGSSRTHRSGRTTSGKNQTLDSGFSFWMKSLTSAAASLIDRKGGAIPLLKTLTGHRGWVMAVAFSPDGQLLATGSGDSTIRLWDPSSGKLLQTIEGHDANVTCLAFSPDGRVLASGSEDKTIRIWGVGTGKLLRTLTGHEGGVRCLAFSPLREMFIQKSSGSNPGTQQLASGGDDRIVKLWDINSGSLITDLKGHTSVVTSLAFNPDGLLGLFLASGSSDKTIRIWDIGTKELVRTLEGHTAGVWSVAFSPSRDTPLPNRPRGSKTLMASGGEDRSIRIWDITSGRTVYTFSGHTSRVRSVIFSPDGSSIVSGSGDKTVKVWDMGSGRLISTLTDHKFGIWSVAFCPTRIPSPIKPRSSSYIMASGSGDNAAKLWLFTRF